MTVLVGIRCTDGVVIGADNRATSAHGALPTVSLETASKIRICGDSVILAATGSVGHAQRLTHHVEEAIRGGVFRSLKVNDCITNISKRLLTDFQATLVQRTAHHGIGFGALLGTVINGTPVLVEYDTVGFQPEIKQPSDNFFVSLGSGQPLADPFLAFIARVLWKGQAPTVADAKFGVYWALDHTIKLAPGGVGGPVKIAVIEQVGGSWLCNTMPDTQELSQYIAELETHLGNFAKKSIDETLGEPVPQPPPALS